MVAQTIQSGPTSFTSSVGKHQWKAQSSSKADLEEHREECSGRRSRHCSEPRCRLGPRLRAERRTRRSGHVRHQMVLPIVGFSCGARIKLPNHESIRRARSPRDPPSVEGGHPRRVRATKHGFTTGWTAYDPSASHSHSSTTTDRSFKEETCLISS